VSAHYAEAVARQEAADFERLELQRAYDRLLAELEITRSALATRAAIAPETSSGSFDGLANERVAPALPPESKQGAPPGSAATHAFEDGEQAVVHAKGASIDPRMSGDVVNASSLLPGSGPDAANVSASLLDSVSETQGTCGCLCAQSPPPAEPRSPIWPHVLSVTFALLALAFQWQARRDRAAWNEERAALERRALATDRTEGSACASAGSRASLPRIGASCGDDWVDAGTETAEPLAEVDPLVLGASTAASPVWGMAAAADGLEPRLQGLAADRRTLWDRVTVSDRPLVDNASDSGDDVRSLSSAEGAARGGCTSTAAASHGSAGDAFSMDEAEEPEADALSRPKVIAQAPAHPDPQAGAVAALKAGVTALIEEKNSEKAGVDCARAAWRAPEVGQEVGGKQDAGGAQFEADLAWAVRPPGTNQRESDPCGSLCVHWVGAGDAHEDSPPSVISPVPPLTSGLTLPNNLLTWLVPREDVAPGAVAGVGARDAPASSSTHIAMISDGPLQERVGSQCTARADDIDAPAVEARGTATAMCAAGPGQTIGEDGHIGTPRSFSLASGPRRASDCASADAYPGGDFFKGSQCATAHRSTSAMDTGEAFGTSTDTPALAPPGCAQPRVSAADHDNLGMPGRLPSEAAVVAHTVKQGTSRLSEMNPLTVRMTQGGTAGCEPGGKGSGLFRHAVADDSLAPPRGSAPGPLIPDMAEIDKLNPQSSPQPSAAHRGECAHLQPPERMPPPERRQLLEPLLPSSPVADPLEYEYESPPEDEVNETIDLEDDESVLVLPLGTPPNSPPSLPVAPALHSPPSMVGSASSGPTAAVPSDRLRPPLPPISSASDTCLAGTAATQVHSRVVAPPVREDYF
jgi:hypothetical protein